VGALAFAGAARVPFFVEGVPEALVVVPEVCKPYGTLGSWGTASLILTRSWSGKGPSEKIGDRSSGNTRDSGPIPLIISDRIGLWLGRLCVPRQ
jgi:hypothetical protein